MAVESALFSPAFAENVKRMVRHAGAQRRKHALQEGEALHAAAQTLQKKRQKFLDLYGEERLDRGALLDQLNQLSIEQKRIEHRRAALEQDCDKIVRSICAAVGHLRGPAAEKLPTPAPRRLETIRALVNSASLSGEERVQINWRAPYHLLMRPALLDALAARAATPAKRSGAHRAKNGAAALAAGVSVGSMRKRIAAGGASSNSSANAPPVGTNANKAIDELKALQVAVRSDSECRLRPAAWSNSFLSGGMHCASVVYQIDNFARGVCQTPARNAQGVTRSLLRPIV